jgi:hypothetical protein
LVQITITVPERRIVRHFSHIGLTLALTFTIPLGARWLRRRGEARCAAPGSTAPSYPLSMQRQTTPSAEAA